ncbi:phage integrase SAM-like domain-containing protein [Bacteroidota bacterium]
MNYKLTFEKITLHFNDKFFPYLVIDKNMLNNTAHKQIQFFKTFLIWANQRALTKNTAYLRRNHYTKIRLHSSLNI